MTPYYMPLPDRRCHESIRMAAKLLALQVRQGFVTADRGQEMATEMGICPEVMQRAIEACK